MSDQKTELSLWNLLLLEAGLFTLLMASYFVGLSLGTESFGAYWHRVIEGGIQWAVTK